MTFNKKEALLSDLIGRGREKPPRSLEEEAKEFLHEVVGLAKYRPATHHEAYKTNQLFVRRTLFPPERGAQILWVAFFMVPETKFRESNNPDHYTKEVYREAGYAPKEGPEVTLILLPPYSNPQPILHPHPPVVVESKFSARSGLVVPTEFEGERTQRHLRPLELYTNREGELHSIWSNQLYHHPFWIVTCDINQLLHKAA